MCCVLIKRRNNYRNCLSTVSRYILFYFGKGGGVYLFIFLLEWDWCFDTFMIQMGGGGGYCFFLFCHQVIGGGGWFFFYYHFFFYRDGVFMLQIIKSIFIYLFFFL